MFNHKKGITLRNQLIIIILTIPVLDVECKDISRLNVPMLQTETKAMTQNLRKEEKGEEVT